MVWSPRRTGRAATSALRRSRSGSLAITGSSDWFTSAARALARSTRKSRQNPRSSLADASTRPSSSSRYSPVFGE